MLISELIVLLYSAYYSFQTVEVRWEYTYQNSMMRVALQRWKTMEPGSTFLDIMPPERDEPVVSRYHFWWQRSDCWREDVQYSKPQPHLTVTCGNQWWKLDAVEQRLSTNIPGLRMEPLKVDFHDTPPPSLDYAMIGIPLLDPSFLLMSHAFSDPASTTYLGRDAISVHAVYQKKADWLPESFFWATSDEYRLTVDRATGLVLRYAAVIEGQEWAVTSVQKLILDEPIDPAVFQYPPVMYG